AEPHHQRRRSLSTQRLQHELCSSFSAPPSKITVSVNPAEEPEEGEYVTISCQSDGVPACNMTLRRQTNGQYTELQSSVGSNLSYTIPSIQLEDTGLYECEALNEHGRQNHTVQVMVKASPRNTTVQVSPSWNVPQGRNITVSCTTVSFPAATAVLRRLSDTHLLNESIADWQLFC
uniref:Ig-like domain-containing protein n=1 Tax=Scleropages formosus TaxID=113540 RepID=A0A8C9S8D5_SCLFO